MLFTTRFWGSTAVLLCALLFQNCHSSSVSATEEEEPAASLSASAVRQYTSSNPLAGSLAVFSASSVAHVSPSYLMKLPSNKEKLPTVPYTRPLNPSESSPIASVGNPLEDSKPPAKRRYINMAPEHYDKQVRDGEKAELDKTMALLQSLLVSLHTFAQR